jgi:hypothetical protein
MNLATLAALRGEAWARRLHRDVPAQPDVAAQPWPGEIEEARRLAGALGSPRLVDHLAILIQEHAAAAWIALTKPQA